MVWLRSFPSISLSDSMRPIRIETRDIFYADSLREVDEWWAGLPGCEPSVVPEIARLPMYSTWYSFHL